MGHSLIGNIFESKAQTLVNTVNCVGIIGKGLALEFKKLFPDMYEDYVARCKAHQVKLGEPYLYRGLFPPWVLNFVRSIRGAGVSSSLIQSTAGDRLQSLPYSFHYRASASRAGT